MCPRKPSLLLPAQQNSHETFIKAYQRMPYVGEDRKSYNFTQWIPAGKSIFLLSHNLIYPSAYSQTISFKGFHMFTTSQLVNCFTS